jgi:O-acetyl-ADP-ribose deacetylase (regulator of RNase III)
MAELDAIRASSGGCPTGSAVVTGAGSLPARFVFHAVGPIYRDGRHGEPEQLAGCYNKCLELAERHGVHTISFPAISTGIYGYPLEEAAGIALDTIASRLRSSDCTVDDALLILFDQSAYAVYSRITSSRSAGSP